MSHHPTNILWQIKFAHTLLWAVFVAAILAIPILTVLGDFVWALAASLLVWAEVLVLFFNRMHCPLTAIAARQTQDRRDNFDIFLPAWLARNNKLIFGSLFVAAELFLLARWVVR